MGATRLSYCGTELATAEGVSPAWAVSEGDQLQQVAMVTVAMSNTTQAMRVWFGVHCQSTSRDGRMTNILLNRQNAAT